MSVATTTATTTCLSTNGNGSHDNIVDDDDHNNNNNSPFLWTLTEEPHRSRRMAIIKAHPEVLKLCGPEPLTKYLIALVVLLQLVMAMLLRNTSPFSLTSTTTTTTSSSCWTFWLAAYVIGATANQNLFLGIHELSHNLVFRDAKWNRIYAVFANLPIIIPYTAVFRPYHLTHHKSLGVDGLDSDIPTALEAYLLNSFVGKIFFCTFQIFFYAIRPMCVYQIPISKLQLFNLITQMIFNVALIKYVGWNAFFYLVASSILSGSLHPCAGHFIAEHYVFDHSGSKNKDNGKQAAGEDDDKKKTSLPSDPSIPLPETYSYYGILNAITYNVGYHNEHHDFPAIPWSRLPKLHRIAPEFYNNVPTHSCWIYVIYQFIMDDRVGLWCRVKRNNVDQIRPVGLKQQVAAVGNNNNGLSNHHPNNNNNAWREDELDANVSNSNNNHPCHNKKCH